MFDVMFQRERLTVGTVLRYGSADEEIPLLK